MSAATARVGVQLYSLRETADRAGAFAALAAAGIGAVEPYDLSDVPRLRADAGRYGLAIPSVHAREPDPVTLERVAELGAHTLVIPRSEPEDWADADGIRRVGARLAAWQERAAAAGLGLAYHNHYWELGRLPDGRHGLDLLAAATPPDVGFQMDLYWAHVGGADVAALLRRLGDRVRSVHVKDGPGDVAADQVELGHGTLPVADVLAAAPPGAMRILEIDRCAGPVLDLLARNRAALARLDPEVAA
ncbi:sugar phosphate isomerase/epimerase family protein [Jiangella rhizosphaerae]|uniref:Sugar phosphate isomerase/epimerase n=1 Tax=Jiangella rhizosphaerae TaxID=2293569 RepID=A0A418KR17_9ACTN|nr:TIM barrel protein [Jiangella rhizosphaerae]RIQ23832.1 sugar phosphate isomerase/epimerase [Jiangella rhizosphaerae]